MGLDSHPIQGAVTRTLRLPMTALSVRPARKDQWSSCHARTRPKPEQVRQSRPLPLGSARIAIAEWIEPPGHARQPDELEPIAECRIRFAVAPAWGAAAAKSALFSAVRTADRPFDAYRRIFA